jgi:hypothetical protein
VRELADINRLDEGLFSLAEVLLSQPDEHRDITIKRGSNLPAPPNSVPKLCAKNPKKAQHSSWDRGIISGPALKTVGPLLDLPWRVPHYDELVIILHVERKSILGLTLKQTASLLETDAGILKRDGTGQPRSH